MSRYMQGLRTDSRPPAARPLDPPSMPLTQKCRGYRASQKGWTRRHIKSMSLRSASDSSGISIREKREKFRTHRASNGQINANSMRGDHDTNRNYMPSRRNSSTPGPAVIPSRTSHWPGDSSMLSLAPAVAPRRVPPNTTLKPPEPEVDPIDWVGAFDDEE